MDYKLFIRVLIITILAFFALSVIVWLAISYNSPFNSSKGSLGLIQAFEPQKGTMCHYEPEKLLEQTEDTSNGVLVTASWYSKEHCLGCNRERIMANGEILDDNAKTVAYNKVPLGTWIKICKGDICEYAKVTDRIGRKDRIDLTKGLFEKFADLDQGLVEVWVDVY